MSQLERYMRRIRAPVTKVAFPFQAKENADKALDEFISIVNSLNVTSFLLSGTCLGFIRDKGYIENDNDIDIGVISKKKKFCVKEDKAKLNILLMKKGFKVGSYWNFHVHWWKYYILLDVHYFKKEAIPFLNSFDNVQYNGQTYNVPHPVNEYLKSCYGNWRIKPR